MMQHRLLAHAPASAAALGQQLQLAAVVAECNTSCVGSCRPTAQRMDSGVTGYASSSSSHFMAAPSGHPWHATPAQTAWLSRALSTASSRFLPESAAATLCGITAAQRSSIPAPSACSTPAPSAASQRVYAICNDAANSYQPLHTAAAAALQSWRQRALGMARPFAANACAAAWPPPAPQLQQSRHYRGWVARKKMITAELQRLDNVAEFRQMWAALGNEMNHINLSAALAKLVELKNTARRDGDGGARKADRELEAAVDDVSIGRRLDRRF